MKNQRIRNIVLIMIVVIINIIVIIMASLSIVDSIRHQLSAENSEHNVVNMNKNIEEVKFKT